MTISKLGMSEEIKPIKLFGEIEILPNVDQYHAVDFLKHYYAVDSLGDTIYIKVKGNDKTTIAITFEFNEISLVRKIKDESGNNLDEIIFKKDDEDLDEEDYGEDYED